MMKGEKCGCVDNLLPRSTSMNNQVYNSNFGFGILMTFNKTCIIIGESLSFVDHFFFYSFCYEIVVLFCMLKGEKTRRNTQKKIRKEYDNIEQNESLLVTSDFIFFFYEITPRINWNKPFKGHKLIFNFFIFGFIDDVHTNPEMRWLETTLYAKMNGCEPHWAIYSMCNFRYPLGSEKRIDDVVIHSWTNTFLDMWDSHFIQIWNCENLKCVSHTIQYTIFHGFFSLCLNLFLCCWCKHKMKMNRSKQTIFKPHAKTIRNILNEFWDRWFKCTLNFKFCTTSMSFAMKGERKSPWDAIVCIFLLFFLPLLGNFFI